MQSLNEVMPKKYQLLRDGNQVIQEANDLGTLVSAMNQSGSEGGKLQIIDTSTGVVLHVKTGKHTQ